MQLPPLFPSVSCVIGMVVFAPAAFGQPLPVPDHIVIVFEENRSYSNIIGNAAAPYINGLISQGASLTNSFAITHPSQPNYLAFFSGSTQGVTTNNTPTTLPFTAPNLGAQLLAAGRTFVGYSEALPSVGFTGDNAGGASGYYRKHNPWVNWQQIGSPPYPANTFPASVNQPYTAFPSNYATLPTLSIIVPTQANDMHDGTIAQGDTWLAANLDGYVQWAKTHNSLFVLTWDEDDSSSNNRIPTLLVGQSIIPGSTTNQLINHYNMLGTFEDMYGLPRIAGTVGLPALTGIYTVPEPASFLTAGGAGLAAWYWYRHRRRSEQEPSAGA